MKVKIKSYEELNTDRKVNEYGDIEEFYYGYKFTSWMKQVCSMTASVVNIISPGLYVLADFIDPNGMPANDIDEDIYCAVFTYEMVEEIAD